MTEFIQVVTTTATLEDAEKIARAVIHSRHAACAQVLGPIKSFFHWKGGVEEERESLCVMKTLEKSYEALERVIRENHSYEVPEIVALSIHKGGEDYLSWIRGEVRVADGK